VLGSASFTAPAPTDLKVEINSLHRDASGVTTLVWTLRNDGGASVSVAARFTNLGSLADSDAGTASGVELVDTTGRLRYQPLHTSTNRCLCAEFIRAGAESRIGPGESATYASTYKLPPELRAVELRIPWSTSPGATVTGLTVK
jgi:hypothetical protein